MSTMVKPVLIGRDWMDITDQYESDPVLAALREANGRPGETRPGGFVWLFRLGSNDADPTLLVGVRGEIGALAWYEGYEELVPADGLNEDEADRYWTWFGDESPLPQRSELPISVVYRALGEWISTHRRPECVRWM